ncbi:hypothetical protein, partial [Streptomyces sp. KR55]|uniref:hypothetical protein n=1 Tax=Streptomyces sp. KR55 TaxID=3457425 RepID=UPI003FD581B4
MLALVIGLLPSNRSWWPSPGWQGGQDCDGACREGPYRDTPAGLAATSAVPDSGRQIKTQDKTVSRIAGQATAETAPPSSQSY